jgi:hypothetical protein
VEAGNKVPTLTANPEIQLVALPYILELFVN